MSAGTKAPKDGLGILVVGGAACAACCAGPIFGFLAAIGIGSIAAVSVGSGIGLVITAVAVVGLVRRRRQRAIGCAPADPVAVELGRRSS